MSNSESKRAAEQAAKERQQSIDASIWSILMSVTNLVVAVKNGDNNSVSYHQGSLWQKVLEHIRMGYGEIGKMQQLLQAEMKKVWDANIKMAEEKKDSAATERLKNPKKQYIEYRDAKVLYGGTQEDIIGDVMRRVSEQLKEQPQRSLHY